MGRRAATFLHATFSIAAGALYFFFVLPRWPELMGDTSHGLGTALRIVTGEVIALAAVPVVFTLRRTRQPEYGTPQLALTLQTWSIVAHVLAGVLIVGTAISEIWLSLDAAGQWLFGIYAAAAAIAVLGIFGFYLSFVAELPPPPPKPLKPKNEKQRRRRKRGEKAEETTADGEAEATDTDTDDDPAGADDTGAKDGATAVEDGDAAAAEPAQQESAEVTTETSPPKATEDAESAADVLPTAEDSAAKDTAVVEAQQRGLRNRRPSGKSSQSHRRKRSRRGVAVED